MVLVLMFPLLCFHFQPFHLAHPIRHHQNHREFHYYLEQLNYYHHPRHLEKLLYQILKVIHLHQPLMMYHYLPHQIQL
jgi:hypothetical protein